MRFFWKGTVTRLFLMGEGPGPIHKPSLEEKGPMGTHPPMGGLAEKGRVYGGNSSPFKKILPVLHVLFFFWSGRLAPPLKH